MRPVIIITLILNSILVWGQVDTFRVMHYNLLNYRNNVSYCHPNNNPTLQKEKALRTIIQYVKPDLVTFNEIGAKAGHSDSLALNCFNSDYAGWQGVIASNLCNAIVYRKGKVRLVSSDTIKVDQNGEKLVRPIDVVLFRIGTDSIDMLVYVAHLKAGNSGSDRYKRALAAQAIMQYQRGQTVPNFMLLGDLNLYNSEENAYKFLTSGFEERYVFQDPVAEQGTWHDNEDFALYHTQSTHQKEWTRGCASTGGLDDRFDFILCSGAMMDNTHGVLALPGSYRAIGNGGDQLNESLMSDSIGAVPESIRMALYDASDHLPVQLDLVLRKRTAAITGENFREVRYSTEDDVLHWATAQHVTGHLLVRDVMGTAVIKQSITLPVRKGTIQLSGLSNGLYIIELHSKGRPKITYKLWVN